MAKAIKTKVDYQVSELVSNLNEAATTTSEQKRDFYTTRALYNAKRLSTILGKAKVGAMALIVAVGMTACGSATSENTADSTAVKADSTATITTDSTTAPVADTTSVVK